MSSEESGCGTVVDGRLRIGREGQGVDYSWRSQPEGIDFSCSLLFQSRLEDSSLALFQNPRLQKRDAKSANECYPTTNPLFGMYALDIRGRFRCMLTLGIYTVSPCTLWALASPARSQLGSRNPTPLGSCVANIPFSGNWIQVSCGNCKSTISRGGAR